MTGVPLQPTTLFLLSVTLLQQVMDESFPIHPIIAIAKKDATAAFVEIDLPLSGILRKSFLFYRIFFRILLSIDQFPLGRTPVGSLFD